MKFKEFILDKFQEDAVKSLDKGNSVVVSAATGTGKTLIADYLINKYMGKNRRIIYTAPIKALSNQKYRDFVEEYGEDNIGIMTGDVVINPDAFVLIMTTEIYRNMLLSKDEITDYIDYVIFDEIHYINDIERGTVWEESVIFSPNHIKFLCLSATIPNAREFADWIASIKTQTVDVVTYEKRAVPLLLHFFEPSAGICDFERIKLELETPDYFAARSRGRRKKRPPAPNHIDLIKQIKDKTPALFFVFSRKECERKAAELAKKMDFRIDRRKVTEVFNSIVSPQYRALESSQLLKQVLSRGIAFHHAGILPTCKEAVEKLFGMGLVKVLYATETFAVGINYPARTVCFSSLRKYDGISFRYLFTKEFFQMAGRAGRRGMDKVGYVYCMINKNEDEASKIKKITSKDIEPIKSQYRLSINTVINMMYNYPDDATREMILKSSFDYYQKKKVANIRIMARFNNIRRKLERLGFIKDNKLTHKGIFARRIYDNEILVTNLFTTDLYKHLSDIEMGVLCASVIYERGRKDKFDREGAKQGYRELVKKVKRFTEEGEYIDTRAIFNLQKLVSRFISGEELKDVLDYSNLAEGDVIRILRRTIDLLRQIRKAADDIELQDKCGLVMHKINKPPVLVEF